MAGLAAEKSIVGPALIGSGSDLERATGLAIQVLNTGLDTAWGVQSVGRWSQWNMENGHAFGDRADAAVRRLLGAAERQAEELVERLREPILRFAQRLDAATELADDDLRVALRESGLWAAADAVIDGSPTPSATPTPGSPTVTPEPWLPDTATSGRGQMNVELLGALALLLGVSAALYLVWQRQRRFRHR